MLRSWDYRLKIINVFTSEFIEAHLSLLDSIFLKLDWKPLDIWYSYTRIPY